MSFQGSASVRRPIATAAAAVVILLAGSTLAYAKDGQGKGGGGGGGGGGRGQQSAQRSVSRAPQQAQGRQVQQQQNRSVQRAERREAAPAPRSNKQPNLNNNSGGNAQQVARSQQRATNQQIKQSQEQAQQVARAQQRTMNQQNKQAQEAVRLQEKLAQKEVKQEKQAFLGEQRDQKRALEQTRLNERRLERAEVKNLNQLEKQQKSDARDLKRTENRAAEDMRRQNKIDQKLTDNALAGGRNARNPEKFNGGNRADNGVQLDSQRRGRGRNNIIVDGDGNTVIKNKTVNKYYGYGRGSYCGNNWYNDCDDDNWSFSIGFSSWGCNSIGFSYNWYDNDCWRPCRPTWCGPSWYYRSYCWPTFTSYCPPPRVYYVYPSYVCHPAYTYTSGTDYGYYGSVGVSTYSNTAYTSSYDTSYATDLGSDDVNPFAVAADDTADFDWSVPGDDYSDTFEPSSSPTAEMARGNAGYGSMSGDLTGAVKPDRAFDNQPASDLLNANIAWQLMEDARYQDALTRFSAAAQADSGDAASKVGYALAAAMLGRDDTAAWAMRRAFVLDADTVGFIPESDEIRRGLDTLANRLNAELQSNRSDAMVNVSDRWFLLAAVEYLRRDTSAAKTALDRSIQTDQVRDSTANFQRLLDRGG